MKVQLIQPSTGSYRSNSRSGCYPPLGLISMATYIRQECPSVQVEIMDGELVSDDEIISLLDADIVGLNTNTVTYPQAVKIASEAKKLGSRIVLGGVYASAIPELILNKRTHLIDSLIVGYGEQPIVDIIHGENEKLIVNHEPDFDHLPFPDRSLVNLDDYVRIFQNNHPTWNYRATNLFSNVGCSWRETSGGGCIFCSRSGTRAIKRDPAIIWEEIRDMAERFQINYLVDFTDSILQDIDWLESVIKAKPKDLNPPWHVFARMDEISLDSVILLKHLPCKHIFIGIESGDSFRYQASQKGGGSPEQSREMSKLLREFDIELTPSYVIGLPGETENTLHRTYEHAQTLHEITGFEEVFCSELIPFPGSKAFRWLNRKVSFDTDVLDIDELKCLWASHYCSVPYESMEEYTQKILDLGSYKITISKNLNNHVVNHLKSSN